MQMHEFCPRTGGMAEMAWEPVGACGPSDRAEPPDHPTRPAQFAVKKWLECVRSPGFPSNSALDWIYYPPSTP